MVLKVFRCIWSAQLSYKSQLDLFAAHFLPKDVCLTVKLAIRSHFGYLVKLFGSATSAASSTAFDKTDLIKAYSRTVVALNSKWLSKRPLKICYVRVLYLTVDKERVELVGPDCACAEWLLRNGASVRFKGHPEMLSDYNTLIALEESSEQKHLKVEDIHARGADISVWGFDHLKNCNHVKKISLIFCNRINDAALFKLKYVEDTLQYLEITSCFNVKDEGVKSLVQLRNLTVLKLGNLVSVKNVEDCEADLRRGLPKCKIEFKKSS